MDLVRIHTSDNSGRRELVAGFWHLPLISTNYEGPSQKDAQFRYVHWKLPEPSETASDATRYMLIVELMSSSFPNMPAKRIRNVSLSKQLNQSVVSIIECYHTPIRRALTQTNKKETIKCSSSKRLSNL